jgi:hypothetical protein
MLINLWLSFMTFCIIKKVTPRVTLKNASSEP